MSKPVSSSWWDLDKAPRIEFTTHVPVIKTEGWQEGMEGSQEPKSTSCQAWAMGRIWNPRLLDKWILSILLQVVG